jgi:hypothetical protein
MMEVPDVDDDVGRGEGAVSDAGRDEARLRVQGRDHEAADAQATDINTLPTMSTVMVGEPAGVVNEVAEILW